MVAINYHNIDITSDNALNFWNPNFINKLDTKDLSNCFICMIVFKTDSLKKHILIF